VAPVGRRGVEQLLEIVANPVDCRLPEVARVCLAALGSQLRALKAQILEFDRRIIAWHRSNATSKRLDAIPGVGPVLATALVASIADPRAFRSGRDFSAWVGLVPKKAGRNPAVRQLPCCSFPFYIGRQSHIAPHE
jgi:transposase